MLLRLWDINIETGDTDSSLLRTLAGVKIPISFNEKVFFKLFTSILFYVHFPVNENIWCRMGQFDFLLGDYKLFLIVLLLSTKDCQSRIRTSLPAALAILTILLKPEKATQELQLQFLNPQPQPGMFEIIFPRHFVIQNCPTLQRTLKTHLPMPP